jgi:hypothetical protein
VNVITFSSTPDKENTPYNDVWVEDCPSQELLDCYEGWEPDVRELLAVCPSPIPYGWSLISSPFSSENRQSDEVGSTYAEAASFLRIRTYRSAGRCSEYILLTFCRSLTTVLGTRYVTTSRRRSWPGHRRMLTAATMIFISYLGVGCIFARLRLRKSFNYPVHSALCSASL